MLINNSLTNIKLIGSIHGYKLFSYIVNDYHSVLRMRKKKKSNYT